MPDDKAQKGNKDGQENSLPQEQFDEKEKEHSKGQHKSKRLDYAQEVQGEKAEEERGFLKEQVNEGDRKAEEVMPVNPFEDSLEPTREPAQDSPVPVNPFESVDTMPPEQKAGVFAEAKMKEDMSGKAEKRRAKEEERKLEEQPFAEPLNPVGPPSPEVIDDQEESYFKPLEPEEENKEKNTPEEIGESEEKQTDMEGRDVIDAEVVSSGEEKPNVTAASGGSALTGGQEFKENAWDILAQAGITKKRIIWMSVILGGVIFLLIAYFSNWFGLFGGSDDAEAPEEPPVLDDTGAIGSISEAYDITSSYIFGLEFSAANNPIVAYPVTSFGSNSGIIAAFELGLASVQGQVDFLHYFEILRKIKNLFETDVYALIDLSVDRRAALNNHLNEMKTVIDEAEMINLLIAEKLVLLGNQYAFSVEERDVLENSFFISADSLQGQPAYEFLRLFSESAHVPIDLKAQIGAYNLLSDKYKQYLSAIKPRYSDILINQEALIQGVRVFDLPNSDIEAIIPVTIQ